MLVQIFNREVHLSSEGNYIVSNKPLQMLIVHRREKHFSATEPEVSESKIWKVQDDSFSSQEFNSNLMVKSEH